MTASRIIPALWEFFFAGAAPPAFVVYARPGASRHRTTLAVSATHTSLSQSRHYTVLVETWE